MDLRLVSPDLRKLDLFVSEVLALPVFEDERPPRGTAGLADYRLLGEISRLIESGRFTAALGTNHVLWPRPRLPFDQLLLVGAGRSQAMNPQIYSAIVEQILKFTAEREIRRAVVELPGRHRNLIDPELAIAILRQRAENYPNADTWTLVDSPEAQKVISRLRVDRASAWGLGR